MSGRTPLWYYILQEATVFGGAFDKRPVDTDYRANAGRANSGKVKLMTEDNDVGATLGPVGATIVGETLIGLIDHYREKTGRGLDLNMPLEIKDLPWRSEIGDLADVHKHPANRGLTESDTKGVAGADFGMRYLLRNLLYDAGVAWPIAKSNVCIGASAGPSKPCPTQN